MRIVIAAACLLLVSACGSSPAAPQPQQQPPPSSQPPSGPPPPAQPPTWDVDTQGVPRITTHNYIDLGLITKISRFRSGYGHDYWDDFERCRSMKHYFMTPFDSRSRDIRIFAPFDGEIVHRHDEWAGVQMHIRSSANPAFTVVLFHVNVGGGFDVGARVTGGQQIGTHIGDVTMSDIAVHVDAPGGRRNISWFETMTDAVFDVYRARGLMTRQDAIITKAERDAHPLTCSGETFMVADPLPMWVDLR